MNLVKKLKEDGFYYINNINYDAMRRHLRIELMKDPEEMTSAKRLLIFEDMEDYSEEVDKDSAIDGAENEVIDSLIGLSEYLHENKLMYELVTEDRFFNFYTNTKPRIEDME